MRALLLLSASIFFCTDVSNAQIAEEWTRSYGTVANYEENYSVYVDENDDVYSCGYIDEDGISLASIIKYNSAGDQIWIKTFTSGNGFDVFRQITGDGNGHIFVTGMAETESQMVNAITAKYDLDGFLLWSHSFDSGNNMADAGLYVMVDQPGNVYVGGYTEHYLNEYSAGADFLTLKYNSNGSLQWSQTHNGSGDNRDVVYGMTLAPTGHLYVTGTSGILPNDDSGTSGDDWATVKYNTNGDEIWTVTYHNPDLEDFFGETPRAVIVDSENNVIVTGWAANGLDMGDMLTIKYNQDGAELWNERFNEYGSGGEAATWIGLDESDNIYVAGSMMNEAFDQDFCMIKYDKNGNVIWQNLYSGEPGGTDFMSSAAMDNEGNVYLNGFGNFNPDTNVAYDFLTFKINPDGEEIWHIAHDGAALSEDYCWAIALDSENNVYVAGVTIEDNTFTFDATTVKYSAIPDAVFEKGQADDLFTVFPNPSNGIVHLNCAAGLAPGAFVNVFDFSGKLIFSSLLRSGLSEIDLSRCEDGMYSIVMHDEMGIVSTEHIQILR